MCTFTEAVHIRVPGADGVLSVRRHGDPGGKVSRYLPLTVWEGPRATQDTAGGRILGEREGREPERLRTRLKSGVRVLVLCGREGREGNDEEQLSARLNSICLLH